MSAIAQSLRTHARGAYFARSWRCAIVVPVWCEYGGITMLLFDIMFEICCYSFAVSVGITGLSCVRRCDIVML